MTEPIPRCCHPQLMMTKRLCYPSPTIMRMRRSRMWIRRQQLPLHRPSNHPQIGLPDAVEGDGGPIPSADDVPMYAASSAQPSYEQSQTAGKPRQTEGIAKNVQNAKDVKSAKNIQKQSTSAPTVVFGLLGVIIGVIALVFGYISPDRMISLFSPNPQLLTAIICAVVGLILVIVAVVWAIVGAVKKRK